MKDGVSVVICCFNSAGKISQTLASLLKQEFSESIPWEVVLVDNASDDNTSDVARQTWNLSTVPLYIIPELKKGLSNARQSGIRESHYDLVCFIDDDNWVNPHWIESVYNRMKQHPEVALLGGRGEAVFEKEEPDWFKQFQHCYAIGPQAENEGVIQSETGFLYGAGLTLRKEVWNKIVEKGFRFYLSDRSGNNITSGGDMEMCYAIRLAGYFLYYDPVLTFKHYMPAGRITVPYLIRLGGSFGRASVISNIYRSLLLKSNGFDRLKTQVYFLSLLQSLYRFLVYLPVYIKLKRPGKNQIDADYHYAFNLECMKEKISIFGRYGAILRAIKYAGWHDVA